MKNFLIINISKNKFFALFILLYSLVTYSQIIPPPECLEFAGQQKCGYGCVKAVGQIFCGEKPGMTCLTQSGNTKCGFDCKAIGAQITCGDNPGDNCVSFQGKITCGQACRIRFGQVLCGVDQNANGRTK